MAFLGMSLEEINRIIKGEPTMTQLKNQKFKVANATISRLLQEELLKQGYKWPISGAKVTHEQKPYLYTYDNGILAHGVDPQHYNEHENEETRIITENKLVIAELQTVRPKTIIFGKTYYKDDVDAALAKLEVARV
jgi:hypothetical protein